MSASTRDGRGWSGMSPAWPLLGPPDPPTPTVLLHRLRIGAGDVLTFYDGDDLTARVLGQYSGPRGHVKLFTSMADVTIQFQSDPGTSVLGYQQGFVIHFFGKLVPVPFPPYLEHNTEPEPWHGQKPEGSGCSSQQGRALGVTSRKLVLSPIFPEQQHKETGNPLLQQEGFRVNSRKNFPRKVENLKKVVASLPAVCTRGDNFSHTTRP